MNAELPVVDDRGKLTPFGAMMDQRMLEFVKIHKEESRDYRPHMTEYARTYDVKKLPNQNKVFICNRTIGADGLFAFMLDLLNFTADDDPISRLIFDVAIECDRESLDVLLSRGWKFSNLRGDCTCLIYAVMIRGIPDSTDMLEKLLTLGIVPKKGFDKMIDVLENQVNDHSSKKLNPRLRRIGEQDLFMLHAKIELLKRYSVPFPDVKVAE